MLIWTITEEKMSLSVSKMRTDNGNNTWNISKNIILEFERGVKYEI